MIAKIFFIVDAALFTLSINDFLSAVGADLDGGVVEIAGEYEVAINTFSATGVIVSHDRCFL